MCGLLSMPMGPAISVFASGVCAHIVGLCVSLYVFDMPMCILMHVGVWV